MKRDNTNLWCDFSKFLVLLGTPNASLVEEEQGFESIAVDG